MKAITIASLMAVTMSLPQLASGAIVLAGWHEFTPTAAAQGGNSAANEGVAGIFNSGLTNLTHRATTSIAPNAPLIQPGGSTDGWYGPDSPATGGIRTEQTLDIPGGSSIWMPEATELDGPPYTYPRLVPGYTDSVDPTSLTPNTSVVGGSNSNFDGRIANMNGTDITITNNSNVAYSLQSFVFDAFLGDVTQQGQDAVLQAFTYTVGTNTDTLLPSFGITGYNSTGGQLLNTNFDSSTGVVPNIIDYGTGTNYVDYVINLGGLLFKPGDSFTIGFASVGNGTIRLDNVALLAVPEPGSLMMVVGLVGSGCFFRRRKQASI